jgi:tRNA nucleotidyltransferase (CCA-adding enzyme)
MITSEAPVSMKMFLVGGAVRDGLLGRQSKDLDFSVEIPSMIGQPVAAGFDAMRDAVEAQGFTIFVESPEHLTLRAKFPKGHVNEKMVGDFVLCREDGPSSDGRHPEWVQVGDLAADLRRRDFTINALAMDEDGNIIDHHRGVEDLKSGALRFVGNPWDRLQEDALRAFRGFRFQITKGLVLDSAARSAIRSMEVDQFDAVSTERIREELTRCFAFDTSRTLLMLGEFPTLLRLALGRGLWLKPTLEDR